MEENRIHNIELALEAFRAINTFWFLKGPYPKNYSADFWDEEDYQDESLRNSMRADFEDHLEMLKNVCRTHVQSLMVAVPNIESEYNNIVLTSRNMESAISLFKEKFEKAMFSLEKECDANELLLRFIVPLMKNDIITRNEGNIYQDYVCDIVISYSHAVNIICSVFNLEYPWNQINPNLNQIPQQNKGEDRCATSELSEAENADTHKCKSLSEIDFSSMTSFMPINDESPNLNALYRHLVNTKVISNIDQGVFENCVSHTFFSPMYRDGNKVNILYTISQLKAFYDDAWLDNVCADLKVDKKRITQRPPSDGFRKGFPSLTHND